MTLSEIASQLKIPRGTAHQRLRRAGIKPIATEYIYPESALEAIRDVSRGRPPKPPLDLPAYKECNAHHTTTCSESQTSETTNVTAE
jgi:hypothetical protein